jgi:hypothetical protein
MVGVGRREAEGRQHYWSNKGRSYLKYFLVGCSEFADWLRAGRSGDRIPVGTTFSAPAQTGPGSPPSLLYNGYRVFPGGKERPGRDIDPSPLLVPWSRKGRAIPLLPLWAVRPVQSLSACTSVPLQWNRNEFPFGSHLSSSNKVNHIYSKQALHL